METGRLIHRGLTCSRSCGWLMVMLGPLNGTWTCMCPLAWGSWPLAQTSSGNGPFRNTYSSWKIKPQETGRLVLVAKILSYSCLGPWRVRLLQSVSEYGSRVCLRWRSRCWGQSPWGAGLLWPLLLHVVRQCHQALQFVFADSLILQIFTVLGAGDLATIVPDLRETHVYFPFQPWPFRLSRKRAGRGAPLQLGGQWCSCRTKGEKGSAKQRVRKMSRQREQQVQYP